MGQAATSQQAELAAEGWRWEAGARPTPVRPRRGRHGQRATTVSPAERLRDGLVTAFVVGCLVLSAVAYVVGLVQLVRWVWL